MRVHFAPCYFFRFPFINSIYDYCLPFLCGCLYFSQEHTGVVLLLGRRPSNHPALPDQEQVRRRATKRIYECLRVFLFFYLSRLIRPASPRSCVLLLSTRWHIDTSPRCEQVITVMFDRDSEVEVGGETVRPFANAASAEAWWHRHKLWLLGPNPV